MSGNPENKQRTRHLQSELRKHLMVWDLIGVGDIPEAQDEYDGYISPLLHRLHRGDSVDEIDDYVTTIVRDWFGMDPRPDRERRFAESLIAWWASETGS